MPILLLAAAISWLQAMVWCPFGAGWYRLIVCMIVYSVLVIPPILARRSWRRDRALGTPIGRLPARRLGSRLLGGFAGEAGGRLDAATARREARGSASRAFERRRGFGSPASAQLWFEARCHRWMLPLMTFWFLAFFGVVLTFTPFEAGRPGFSRRRCSRWRPRARPAGAVGGDEARAVRAVLADSFAIDRVRGRSADDDAVVGRREVPKRLASVLLTWAVVVLLVAGAVSAVETGRMPSNWPERAARSYDSRSVWLLAACRWSSAPR